MSKEVIRSSQFSHADPILENESLQISPELQEELDQLYTGLFDELKQGSIINAKIVQADSDGVLIDIGFKSHGLIPPYEFSRHEIKELKEGQEIEVFLNELESFDGMINVSYEKAKAARAWDRITKLFEAGEPVEGVVTHKVKGGLSVDVGIPAFLPGSQVDLQRVTDFDQWVGQKITAHILKINKKRGNIIISRRKHLSEQRSEQRKDILDKLSAEQVIQGIVKNITNYGVFIDIGGVDGLLHITDMTWGRITHPSELVKLGDTITVKVLSFDKDNEKISLGMKQLSENPWGQLPENLDIGSKVKGTISSITDYGLFVEVAKGVEGLVHISEVSWTDRIENLRKHFKVGQEIEAVIVSLDKDNRRMSLSIKKMAGNPWEGIAEEFKVGDKIKGKITNITDFGVFVQLKPGIDGLVYISDLSWTEHIAHPSDRYKIGQEVDAVVLSVDEKSHRVSLGIKQLEPNPWDTIEEEYPVGSIIDGEVSKITNFGAFIKLPTGIEGLVHAKEFPNQKIEDVLSVGQKLQLKVLKVSREDQKIGLTPNLSQTAESAKAPAKKATHQAKREKKAEQPKGKSLLQMELEKHAARAKKDDQN